MVQDKQNNIEWLKKKEPKSGKMDLTSGVTAAVDGTAQQKTRRTTRYWKHQKRERRKKQTKQFYESASSSKSENYRSNKPTR